MKIEVDLYEFLYFMHSDFILPFLSGVVCGFGLRLNPLGPNLSPKRFEGSELGSSPTWLVVLRSKPTQQDIKEAQPYTSENKGPNHKIHESVECPILVEELILTFT